jgi:hypothetical protein
MGLPLRKRTHTITVEPFQGDSAYGPVFGAPVQVTCRVDEAQRLVRSNTGEEVVSSSTVFCDLDTVIPAGSRVTVNGRTTTVLALAAFDTGGRSRLDHKEASLA